MSADKTPRRLGRGLDALLGEKTTQRPRSAPTTPADTEPQAAETRSAFREIPAHWMSIKRLNVVVSIDGLPPEHDERRKPDTYERILKNIQHARVTVHCTITSQIAGRPGYLDEFLRFWTSQPQVVKVWFSFFTPQRGATDPEILPPAQRAAVIAELQRYLRHHPHVDRDQLVAIVRRTEAELSGDAAAAGPDDSGALDVTARGQLVHAKTDGQKRYLTAIANNDLAFCEGPAGTGKTFLAVAMAVSLLRRSIIRRIVLVRPAVEAGEKLGFLPGSIEEKVNPYLRPLLDALSDMMTFDQIRRYMANDVIEVAPLAYMRGRTLNEAIVILDEAQNTTPSQMLMFLTRLGERSKMIVTGDPSQVDLEGHSSGLGDARVTLRGIKGIAFVSLDKSDIVRHRLVQNIVQAYADKNKQTGT